MPNRDDAFSIGGLLLIGGGIASFSVQAAVIAVGIALLVIGELNALAESRRNHQ